MKKFCIALLTLVSIAPALRASTPSGNHAYLQGSVAFVTPGDDFKSGAGASLAVGVSFAKHHAIEMEGILFSTELKDDQNTSYWNSTKVDLKMKPLLMTYRYTFSITERFNIFAGITAGFTYLKYEVTNLSPSYSYVYWTSSSTYTTVYYPATIYRYTGNDNAFTGGAQMGCAYEFTPRSALTLSVKLLYMEDSRILTSGAFTTVQAGYRFTF